MDRGREIVPRSLSPTRLPKQLTKAMKLDICM